MGQKVNPIGLRLGVNKTWQSRWYADPREYADLVLEDIKIRKMVADLPECKNADIAEIEIVRHPQRVTIVIHTARPGVIIGVKGASIEKISADIQKQLTKKVQIKIKEIKRGDLVMSWSFWNGQYEVMPVGVVWYHGTMNWDVLTLKFSDDTQVRMINEHGFFDVDKNTYAYITAKNVDNYIGDKFVKQAADGSNEEVTLLSYTVTNENTGCYSLQTVKNDNFLVEDMISITAEEEYPGKFEFFEVGEGMQYDAAKMQAEYPVEG